MAELKKREKVLMSAATSVLVYFLVNQFVCGKSEPEEEANAQQQPVIAASAADVPTTPAAEPKAAAPKRRSATERIKFASWMRDPFALTYRLAPADTVEADSSDFVMRGVIWKGNQAHVLIGDNVLREGDQVGDLKVLDIDKNRVVVKKKGKIVTLILRDDHE
jgi:hypothetical protein